MLYRYAQDPECSDVIPYPGVIQDSPSPDLDGRTSVVWLVYSRHACQPVVRLVYWWMDLFADYLDYSWHTQLARIPVRCITSGWPICTSGLTHITSLIRCW